MSRVEPEVHPPSWIVLDTATVLFMLAALVFLYSFLFILPSIPIIHLMQDGLIYVFDGKRMYDGEQIYRDFFQFSTPGTPLVYFLLLRIFGVRLWIPNLALLLLGLGLAWLGVEIAKKLIHPRMALLPSAIFLTAVYRTFDATHHWYSLLTATASLASLMERRTPARIAVAGFFCSLTVCFTQSRGLAVVVGFAVFLWWESRRKEENWRATLKKEAWLVGSFFATLIAVNAYFIWEAGLTRFLWCTVVFGVKHHPQYGGTNNPLAFIGDLPGSGGASDSLVYLIHWLFLYAVIPFTYILFFARYWRESGKKPTEFWDRPMLLAILGSSMLVSVVPAPSYFRMAVSALPGIILLGWFIDSPGKLARAVAGCLAVGVLLVIPFTAARFQGIEKKVLTAPQGKIAIISPEIYEVYAWVQQRTQPSQYFYNPAFGTAIYFYLDLRNPTPLPFVTDTGYTTSEQVAEVIRGLEQHPVRYILWDGQELDTFEEWRDASADHLGPLRNYIHGHYRAVKIFPRSKVIWEKKD